METDNSKAEEYKVKGNEFFKISKYEQAINEYTLAIEATKDSNKKAIYLSNRAFCHIKMENLGLALNDATEAIKQDPTYVKGYYR